MATTAAQDPETSEVWSVPMRTRLDGTAYPQGVNLDCEGWTSRSSNRAVQVGHHDGDGLAGGGNDSRSWNSAHLTNCSSAGLDATAGAGYFYCFAL